MVYSEGDATLNKLLEQGYVKKHLRSSLRKFYGRYGDLIKQYEVPLSRMLNAILWPGHIQRQPPTDQTFYQALTLLLNSTFYRILWGFHYRTFARGMACRHVMLTPPDTSSHPFGTCICSTCWGQPLFRTCHDFRTLLFEHPSVLLLVTLGDMLPTY